MKLGDWPLPYVRVACKQCAEYHYGEKNQQELKSRFHIVTSRVRNSELIKPV